MGFWLASLRSPFVRGGEDGGGVRDDAPDSRRIDGPGETNLRSWVSAKLLPIETSPLERWVVTRRRTYQEHVTLHFGWVNRAFEEVEKKEWPKRKELPKPKSVIAESRLSPS